MSCAAENADALAAAIGAMADMTSEQRDAMGLRGRAYYDANFDPDRLAAELMAQFAALTGRGRAEASAGERE
jgi:glycosyltransferase involved in cell wall biosynthesis